MLLLLLLQKSVESWRFLCWWEWMCRSPWAFCTGWGFGHGRLCWKDWIQRSGLWFVRHWPIPGSLPFSIPSFCSPSCKFFWTVAIPSANSDPCQNENGGMLCLVNRIKAVLPSRKCSPKSSTLYASQEALAHLKSFPVKEMVLKCVTWSQALLNFQMWVFVLQHQQAWSTWSPPSDMICMSNRDVVVGLVIKSVKNPRSALCKTALMTSTDLFKAYRDQLLDLLDPLVWTKLHNLQCVCLPNVESKLQRLLNVTRILTTNG